MCYHDYCQEDILTTVDIIAQRYGGSRRFQKTAVPPDSTAWRLSASAAGPGESPGASRASPVPPGCRTRRTLPFFLGRPDEHRNHGSAPLHSGGQGRIVRQPQILPEPAQRRRCVHACQCASPDPACANGTSAEWYSVAKKGTDACRTNPVYFDQELCR